LLRGVLTQTGGHNIAQIERIDLICGNVGLLKEILNRQASKSRNRDVRKAAEKRSDGRPRGPENHNSRHDGSDGRICQRWSASQAAGTIATDAYIDN
jgi:hypothetical protein